MKREGEGQDPSVPRLSRREALSGLVLGVSLAATSEVVPVAAQAAGSVNAAVLTSAVPLLIQAGPAGITPAFRTQHVAVTLRGGWVLVAGGYSMAPLASVELFDPSSNTWFSAAPMGTARARHAAALLADGRVLVVGGANRHAPLRSAEIYNPWDNTWTNVAPALTVREEGAAALLPDSRVLLTGGGSRGARVGPEVYDPLADRWELLG